MAGELRADIVRAFEGARAQANGTIVEPSEFARTVTRWVDGTSRFLAEDPKIAEQRREVLEALDKLVDYLGSAEVNERSVDTFKRHLVSALNALERVTLERGRANERADRVGLGKVGQPL